MDVRFQTSNMTRSILTGGTDWIVQRWEWACRVHILRSLQSRMAAPRPPPVYEPATGRLLYVAASCQPYHLTGYTTRTHELIRALHEAGGDVVVMSRPGYPWDRSDRRCDAESGQACLEGIVYKHVRQPLVSMPVLKYVRQASAEIAKIALDNRVAVIHAASNHINALPALLAARQLGIPFQYEMRGLWELTRISRMPEFERTQAFRQGLELEGLVARNADRLFVISTQLGGYMKTHWGVADERMRLLPNCVDPDRFLPSDPDAVEPWTIAYAGSLIAYEGLDTLLEAVAMMVGAGAPVRLRVMGDGEIRGQLESQAAQLNLGGHVEFLGKVAPDEVRAMLARCAVVCLPRKPFKVCEIVPPIKLAEAMAMGKPVVVPDLPVFRDEVGASEGVRFFVAGDALDLARVITDLLGDPPGLRALGMRAREHVMRQRLWRDHVGQVMLLAQRPLGAKPDH